MIPHKFLVFASTRCVDSGEIGDSPRFALFDSQREALECFKALQSASRTLIQKEIAKINTAENRLVFQSPYLSNAALFRVPVETSTAEDAVAWISHQLADGEDVSEEVEKFEGFQVGPQGETAISLDAFLEEWS